MAMISTNEAMEKLKNFRNLGAILLFIPSTKELLWVKPTDTGDNLTKEDIEEGYNDYLYCTHQFFNDVDECYDEMTDEDAPMIYFNNEVEKYNEDIALAVIPTLQDHFSCNSSDEVEDFIPLFGNPSVYEKPFQVKLFYDGHYRIFDVYAKDEEKAVDAVFEKYNLNRNAEYRVLSVIGGVNNGQ